MAWSATWRGPQVVTGALRKSAATGRESSNGHAQERLRTRRSARPVGVNQGEAATPVWWRPCELRSQVRSKSTNRSGFHLYSGSPLAFPNQRLKEQPLPFSLQILYQQKFPQRKGIREALSFLFSGGRGRETEKRHKVKYLHTLSEDNDSAEQLSWPRNESK